MNRSGTEYGMLGRGQSPWFGRRRVGSVGQAGVLAGLFVATMTLVYFGVESVRNEASTRRALGLETDRAVADLVVARLEAAILETDQALANVAVVGSLTDLRTRVAAVETARPWIAPIALIPAAPFEHRAFVPQSDVAGAFTLAEAVETRDRKPDQAADLYRRIATAAASATDRVEAIGRQARCHVASGKTTAAIAAYRRLLVSAAALDPQQVVWAARAHLNLTIALQRRGDTSATSVALLDLLEFLDTHQFLLDRDQHAFYRSEAEKSLAAMRSGFDAVQQRRLEALRTRAEDIAAVGRLIVLDGESSRATAVEYEPASAAVTYKAASAGAVAIGRTGQSIRLAHAWNPVALTALFNHIRTEPGSWQHANLALVNARDVTQGAVETDVVSATSLTSLPAWRVAVRGSHAFAADSGVVRYAVMIAVVLGAVVLALLLSVRSVVRAARLSQLRAEFVSSVSHDLRTPLSLIRMFADSLRAGWVSPDKQAEYHEVIARESERLTDLVNNVLDFSRLESGARQYRAAETDLRQLLSSLLERYAYHMKVAGITLSETLPGEPVLARVDRDAIEQVVANLLSNAIKYIGVEPDRPREVRVVLNAADGFAVILVGDTGIGVPQVELRRLFDRFYRADDDRVRTIGGSGLGLTLAKAHVEAHGGTIDVQSEPERGSTFTVRLPLLPAQLEGHS